jgi:cysteine desulfurase
MHGGGQEGGRRASTENVPAIVGFGKAAEIARKEMEEDIRRITSLREKLVGGLFARIEGIHLNGHPSLRLPNNANISVASVEGEAMVVSLDLEGIAASTGSACTSSALEASHVLLAIGLAGELTHGSLRFTLGRETTEEEVGRVLELLPRIVTRLRAISPLARGGV